MFRTPTTIIVGAGASKDYGLPLGSELRRQIANLINIGYDQAGFRLAEGDYHIVEALKVVALKDGHRHINAYIPAARQMAEAMSIALSIDNFLDAHQDDEAVLVCGKLAIARAILQAERASTLHSTPDARNEFSLERVQDTWLARLTNAMTEDVPKSNIESLFDNLTIISFNYDRCIKLYLRQALCVYYRISRAEADRLLMNLRLFHPYGSVGMLPYEGTGGVEFGSDCSGEALLAISQGIKTFTERIDDDNLVSAMRDAIGSSKNLLFLGFAFHRQNLRLIAPEAPNASLNIFATTMGISGSDVEVIRDDLNSLFGPEGGNHNFRGLGDTSTRLFESYWRSITS